MNDTLRAVAGEEWAEYRGSLSLSVHERAVIDAMLFKLVAEVEERELRLEHLWHWAYERGDEATYKEIEASLLAARDRKESDA